MKNTTQTQSTPKVRTPAEVLELVKDYTVSDLQYEERKFKKALEEVEKNGPHWSYFSTLASSHKKIELNKNVLNYIHKASGDLEKVIESLTEYREELLNTLIDGPDVNSTSMMSNGIGREKYDATKEMWQKLKNVISMLEKGQPSQ